MLALCGNLWAQEHHANLGTKIRSDVRDAAVASWQIVRAPIHASAGNCLVAAGLLSGVALTSALDRTMRTVALRQQGGGVRTVDNIGHQFQGPLVILGSAGVLYGGGLLADDPAMRRTGAEVVEAFAISGAGTQVVKYLVGRHRPFTNDGPFHFDGWSLPDAHHSFPSGDVTVAFAFSSVLTAETKSWPIGVVLYGLAGMTAFQRMNLDKHWLSDTVGGAVWGTAVGWGVVHVNRQLKHGSVTASLVPKPNGIGVQLRL
jgi:hypothetical protein